MACDRNLLCVLQSTLLVNRIDICVLLACEQVLGDLKNCVIIVGYQLARDGNLNLIKLTHHQILQHVSVLLVVHKVYFDTVAKGRVEQWVLYLVEQTGLNSQAHHKHNLLHYLEDMVCADQNSPD